MHTSKLSLHYLVNFSIFNSKVGGNSQCNDAFEILWLWVFWWSSYCHWQWKRFENRPTFGEVMAKSWRANYFLDHTVNSKHTPYFVTQRCWFPADDTAGTLAGRQGSLSKLWKRDASVTLKTVQVWPASAVEALDSLFCVSSWLVAEPAVSTTNNTRVCELCR